MTTTRTIRPGYDRWALVYDHDANPLPALEEPFVREAIGDVQGLALLDLGCGTGRHALWLAAAGATVTAVDFSEGMLAVARQKPGAGAIRFLLHDLHEPLPFSEETFDLVVSGLVLEQLGDFVTAAVEAGFRLEGIGEYAPDAGFAARYPRAEKYVGWPMLVVLKMRA